MKPSEAAAMARPTVRGYLDAHPDEVFTDRELSRLVGVIQARSCAIRPGYKTRIGAATWYGHPAALAKLKTELAKRRLA